MSIHQSYNAPDDVCMFWKLQFVFDLFSFANEPSMKTADFWIDALNLQPHPEGGFFRESYRSAGMITASGLPSYIGSRHFATSIYYLLNGHEFSSFHKLKSDEVWHFYDGCSLELYIIASDGAIITKMLGKDVEGGESFQQVIPANHWFAAKPIDSRGYSLAGCTMSPGFDINDFEIGLFEVLAKQFPQHMEIIRLLTRT